MKKIILLLFATVLTLTSYSQIVFEKGYFIDNSNERIEGLIKNVDWNSNPSQFEYKLTDDSDVKTTTLADVKELGVYNESKYVKFKVDIDRSTDDVNNMGDKQNPIFNEEVLFLKVLIEGKADLFEYTDVTIKRFFYRVDDSEVKQLVYKRYQIPPKENSPDVRSLIGVNNTYKQQLWNDLKCPSITMSQAEKLEYKRSSLLHFFVQYNKCTDQKFVNYEDKEKKDLFNLNIRPGVNFSSLTMERLSNSEFDFGSAVNFRFGIETEFIMPFNKNKWSIILEPTYQSFKGEAEYSFTALTLDYKSIELPVGARYYLFLNENNKFFLNAQFVFDFSVNSTLENSVSDNLDVNSGTNWAFGLGYKYNDKFSIEARYFTSRNILRDYLGWSTNYKTFSVIVGYTLF